MGKAIVMFDESLGLPDTPYEDVNKVYSGPGGILLDRGRHGDVFIANGKWVTVEFHPGEEKE